MVTDRGVTFTRRSLEPFAPEHAYAAIPSGDQAGLFERAQNVRHGRTTYAEHDGKKLLLQRKIVRIHSVVNLEQPTAAALRDVVKGVTRSALHRLQESRLCV
jgi:hypothetical protein